METDSDKSKILPPKKSNNGRSAGGIVTVSDSTIVESDSFCYQTFNTEPPPDLIADLIVGPKGRPHHGDVEFTPVFQDAIKAIDKCVDPELILQGSSGSYRMKNTQLVRLLTLFVFLLCGYLRCVMH